MQGDQCVDLHESNILQNADEPRKFTLTKETYYMVKYSNLHPQAANIPVRMITIAINKARALIVIRAMCHGSTWGTTGEMGNKIQLCYNEHR